MDAGSHALDGTHAYAHADTYSHPGADLHSDADPANLDTNTGPGSGFYPCF